MVHEVRVLEGVLMDEVDLEGKEKVIQGVMDATQQGEIQAGA